jgi:hypothetical protein
MMKQIPWLFLAVAAIIAGKAAHASDLRTVALTAQPAPDTADAAHFRNLLTPSIDAAGRIAFRATLQTNSGVALSSNNEGLWVDGSGALHLVAREGDSLPGLPGGTLSGFSDASVPLSAGQATYSVFTVSAIGNPPTHGGVWTGDAETVSPTALGATQAPGAPSGQLFESHLQPAVALNNGRVAFRALFYGGAGEGLWSGPKDALTLIARTGSQAPGVPVGAKFGSIYSATPPVVNGSGRTVLRASLQIGVAGVTLENSQGVWTDASGTLSLIARGGGPAAGAPAGAVFHTFPTLSPAINNAGEIAFAATLGTGVGGVDVDNDAGIWAHRDGALQLIAREGSPAPGLPSGVKFGSLWASPILNGTGHTAFSASLAGDGVTAANSRTIFSEGRGALQPVARTGSQAPGTPDGAAFGDFVANGLALNGRGQAAFMGLLKIEGAVTAANDRGLWAQDPAGMLQLIAREGDPLEVAPGDVRTIATLIYLAETGNEDGRASGFNDLGQLAFRATFTDGSSGVFVSSRVAFAAADFDHDGAVDGEDLAAWKSTAGADPGADADADRDGDSDGADFLIWQRQLGHVTPASATVSGAVPEPASMSVAVMAIIANLTLARLVRRRSR